MTKFKVAFALLFCSVVTCYATQDEDTFSNSQGKKRAREEENVNHDSKKQKNEANSAPSNVILATISPASPAEEEQEENTTPPSSPKTPVKNSIVNPYANLLAPQRNKLRPSATAPLTAATMLFPAAPAPAVPVAAPATTPAPVAAPTGGIFLFIVAPAPAAPAGGVALAPFVVNNPGPDETCEGH